ncbi:MAG: hypothetical protein GY711_27405 [bacterium]|nr:hypothetical protein [bacterium]
MKKTTLLLACASAALLASSADAQVARALLREGDALTGPFAGRTVVTVGGPNVNENGGFAARFTSVGGVALNHVFGSGGGAAPGILRTEDTFGPLTQTAFEEHLGISDAGIVSYSATCNGAVVTSADTVWFGDTPVAVEGEPHPTLPGQFWRFASRPDVTGPGIPYFVGGITSTQGGTTENRGLFLGLDGGTVIALGGDVLPGLPEPLSTNASVGFDYRLSALGTHHIYEAGMSGPTVTTSNDKAVVLNGSGLLIGGSLVQEGTLLPVSAGGDGVENWDNFDFLGITELGSYFFSGDTDAATDRDEILVIDGVIAYREGDLIDGKLTAGGLEAAAMNEIGQIAFVWDIDDGGTSSEALFLNGTCLLAIGDEVDWDGNGSVDAGFVVTNFTGIGNVAVGSSSIVFFTADVDALGTILDGLFVYAFGAPGQNYCFPAIPNSSGLPATIRATGSTSAAANSLTLVAEQLPAGQFGYFLAGQTQGFFTPPGSQGVICLSGTIGRFNQIAQIIQGPSGSLAVDLTAIPVSPPVAVQPGETWNFQCWFRDNNPVPTSNFTDGLSVTFD